MSKEQVESQPKTRSGLERMLVWGGIALLAMLVFVEFQAQKNYNAAMEWMRDNEGRSKTLADVRAALSGEAEFAVEGTLGESAVGFKWVSLFKKYELIAEFAGADDSARLTGFYDVESLKAVAAEMEEAENSTELDEPSDADDNNSTEDLASEPAPPADTDGP